MKKNIKSKIILTCIYIFIVCLDARIFEYFIIKTDESIIYENILHKIFGIILFF